MKPIVLVIDDDTGILDALQALLEDEGYPVIASTDPSAALDLIHSGAKLPALLLLDVLLSGSDGREVCRTLRSTPRTQQLPIIMMSAHSDGPAFIDGCDANGFLAKPFDIDDLLNMVQAMI